MTILTNAQKAEAANDLPYVGGSARGWTFISTGLRCWWAFLLRYIVGVVESVRPPYFDVGSVMHAHHEGIPREKIAEEFQEPAVFAEGTKLYELRIKSGPPLPKAKAVEQTVPIFDGLMTSKPDRVEGYGIRDFKSALYFSKNDQASWQVDGGIIGEAVAADVKVAIVDITSKSAARSEEDGKVPSSPVKIVTVTVKDAHRKALERLVHTFWTQLESKMKAAKLTKPSRGMPAPQALEELFPRNLLGCVGKYGPCPYYARCWGIPPDSLMYVKARGTDRWTATNGLTLTSASLQTLRKLIATRFLKEKL